MEQTGGWNRMEQTTAKLSLYSTPTMAPRKCSQNLPLRKARWADMKLKACSPSPQRHLGSWSQIFSWLIAAKGAESVRAQTGTARNCQKLQRDREFSVNHNDINWQKLVGTKQLRSLFLQECSKWQMWSHVCRQNTCTIPEVCCGSTSLFRMALHALHLWLDMRHLRRFEASTFVVPRQLFC